MTEKRAYRDGKRGVVLISTLVSLVLVVGVALVLQSVAISNALVSRKLVIEHESDMAKDAAWAFSRSYVAAVFSTRKPVGGSFEWQGVQAKTEVNLGPVRDVVAVSIELSP